MNNLVESLLRDGNLTSLKTRPARALIGWMPEREAEIMLGIPMAPLTPANWRQENDTPDDLRPPNRTFGSLSLD